MNSSSFDGLSRRQFVATLATGLAALGAPLPTNCFAAPAGKGIFVFSKVYQELSLGYADAAALTAEAGLEGIDCPVRPKGEIEPEKAADELPKYVAALKKHQLTMPLITTAITSTSSPHAESVLRTARSLGVGYYRFGSQLHDKVAPLPKQLAETKAQLKDLAAMNREIGICGIYQNHSPGGRKYIAGDLAEMRELVEGFDPQQIGVAFDIGHAIVVHGQDWRPHFEQLRPHLRIAYVKDVKLPKSWVAIGEGDIHQTGFFKELQKIGYRAPVSLHVEYDWNEQGRNVTRSRLLQVLKQDAGRLRHWLTSPV
jgi:sugar phosphate isomerase/epimerase